MDRAMAPLILNVFSVRRPSEIGRAVVSADAIPMRHLVI
jgi:hypothetical protein